MKAKTQEALSLLDLNTLTYKLGFETQEALKRAKEDLTIENVQEAHRKMVEWDLCRKEFEERFEAWKNS